MATQPTIAVIGSLNMDLVTYLPRIPAGGETASASSFHTGLGGKGANQAVACAKLSRRRDLGGSTVDVRMVGAVGDDAYGQHMKAGLEEFGVDVTGVVSRTGQRTGVAVILVEENSGENRIMLSAEANSTLSPSDFESELLPAAFMGKTSPESNRKPDMVILQLEIPLPTVLQILKTAHDNSIPVLLNPAPAQPLPKEYYKFVDHLVVNETEAMILSGCDAAELEVTNGSSDGLKRVADLFHARGVVHVFITLGGQGVYFSGPNAAGLVPAEKAKVVDTTAAGDTFVGAYALAAVQARHSGTNFDIKQAVRTANKAAAKTVEKKGAQDSIPWLDEL